ncbi:MAG: hypothetical protein A3A28_00180 [Candidatus Sungbacteria bacterium RIFCSPLOWO2_01_FULL_47_32]|nr:MAG: hypothetical protein A3A28_00180 [Candidatus Sungbacteria bacterium RIFCSPLOWO2_01_FULL_47_32]
MKFNSSSPLYVKVLATIITKKNKKNNPDKFVLLPEEKPESTRKAPEWGLAVCLKKLIFLAP